MRLLITATNFTHDCGDDILDDTFSSDDKNGQEQQPTRSPAVTPAPVPPEAAIASTVVSPSVNTTDCPAFKVADTLSVATDAFCKCTKSNGEHNAVKQPGSTMRAAFICEG